jgi:hypothetical protein
MLHRQQQFLYESEYPAAEVRWFFGTEDEGGETEETKWHWLSSPKRDGIEMSLKYPRFNSLYAMAWTSGSSAIQAEYLAA